MGHALDGHPLADIDDPLAEDGFALHCSPPERRTDARVLQSQVVYRDIGHLH